MNVQSLVHSVASSWFGSVQFCRISSQNRSKFGSRTEGIGEVAFFFFRVSLFLLYWKKYCYYIRWLWYCVPVNVDVERSNVKNHRAFKAWTENWLQWISCWWKRTIGCRSKFHSWCMRIAFSANRLKL